MSYGAREVAATLGVSVGQVRAFVRSGFLDPERGPRGELRFSFQDLVLLRTANELVAARIPPRRIRRALLRLRAQLPAGSPLTGVHIRAESGRIVVGDGAARWHPESGQVLFDFGVAEVAGAVAPLALEEEAPLRGEPTAEEWYQFGCDLEDGDPANAADAYRRAVELDENHADARINLGRLMHQAGRPDVAAVQYQLALEARPDDATAAFNLGVALEDMKKPERAIDAYLIAVSLDQRAADAHWNLARLYEARDDRAGALRHLRSYRKLTQR